MLGEKMVQPDSARRVKGICVSSQNPVQRSLAHSYVRSKSMVAALALDFANMISDTQGFAQRLSFCRRAITLAFSGFLARHSAALLAQNPGLASYAAFRAAFARYLAERSRQWPWELCQSIACFWLQNRVRLPVIGARQTMQTFELISMPTLYVKKYALASAKGAP